MTLDLVISGIVRGGTVKVAVGIQIIKLFLDDFRFILLEIDDSCPSLL
jgi:MinD superfamily P-loop ATPase